MCGNWRLKFDTHSPSLHTYREAAEAGATGTVRLADPDVPITIYSEAVAAGAYTGTVSVRDWEGGGEAVIAGAYTGTGMPIEGHPLNMFQAAFSTESHFEHVHTLYPPTGHSLHVPSRAFQQVLQLQQANDRVQQGCGG